MGTTIKVCGIFLKKVKSLYDNGMFNIPENVSFKFSINEGLSLKNDILWNSSIEKKDKLNLN